MKIQTIVVTNEDQEQFSYRVPVSPLHVVPISGGGPVRYISNKHFSAMRAARAVSSALQKPRVMRATPTIINFTSH